VHTQKADEMCDPNTTGANLSKYAQQLLQGMRLSEAHIRHVQPLLTIRSFDEGTLIWAKGRSVQAWNCIMTGYVAAGMPVQRGGRMPLHLFGPDAWFGEQALLDGQPSDLDYICLTPVEVIGMSQACLQEAMYAEPDFSGALLQQMAWRARQHTAMLAVMRTGCMALRLFRGLAQFAQAQSLQAAERISDGDVVDIPIGQDQIAALCGISRTLFSAGLQHLVKAGWVKVRYGAMELQSAQAWRVFAQRQRDSPGLNSRPSMAELLSALKRARTQG
jgi:CRP/FNR family cyclic AMP-dependent transcriptional regulator